MISKKLKEEQEKNRTIQTIEKICYHSDNINPDEFCKKIKEDFKFHIAHSLAELDMENPSVKILMYNPKFYVQFQRYRGTELIPFIKNWVDNNYIIESTYEDIVEEQTYVFTTILKPI
jgi:hypothetical protein